MRKTAEEKQPPEADAASGTRAAMLEYLEGWNRRRMDWDTGMERVYRARTVFAVLIGAGVDRAVDDLADIVVG